MTKFPSAVAYNQAIQSPAITFSDSRLKTATVKLDPRGMPIVNCGGFALTYFLNFNNGSKWVVRCFKVYSSDREQRYKAISRFLQHCNEPIFIGVEYLPSAILVDGQRYPIVLMPFVGGELLNKYIERNVTDKQRLSTLQSNFRKLVETLERLGVAHGDLQHGNILVKKNGELVLVDYDGMYVAALKNIGSAESGHRSYQHPERTDEFNPNLDRFSSIAIDLALTAVIQKSSLWFKYSNGDNLLFRASDFEEPDNSPLLSELQGISGIRHLAADFRDVCRNRMSDTPSLSEFLVREIPRGVTQPRTLKAVHAGNRYPIIDATNRHELLQHVGDMVRVIGKITDIRQNNTIFGKPYAFLNFGDYLQGDMTLIAWSDALELFGQQNISPNQYLNQWVSVRGLLTVYQSGQRPKQPQIVIELPSEIELLKGGAQEAQRLLSPPIVSVPTKTKSATFPPQAPVVKQKPIVPKTKPSYQQTVTPAVLNFGYLWPGIDVQRSLQIKNSGNQPLDISVTSLLSWLRISSPNFRCAPNETHLVTITLVTDKIPQKLFRPTFSNTTFKLSQTVFYVASQAGVEQVRVKASLIHSASTGSPMASSSPSLTTKKTLPTLSRKQKTKWVVWGLPLIALLLISLWTYSNVVPPLALPTQQSSTLISRPTTTTIKSTGIAISPVTLSDDTVSPNEPIHVSINVQGDNIKRISFFSGIYDPETNAIIVGDVDRLETLPSRNPGVTVASFDWEPHAVMLYDGKKTTKILLNPSTSKPIKNPDLTIEGVYKKSGGESRPARMYLSKKGKIQMLGYAENGSIWRRIIPKPGDQFTLLNYRIDLNEQGEAIDINSEEDQTVTFHDQPLTWTELDATAGKYAVGFIIEDIDGNSYPAYTTVRVQ